MTIWPDKEYIKKYLDRLICALYYDKSILEIQYNDGNPISNFVIREEKRISCSSIIIGIDIYKKFINNFINENPELSGDNEISSIIIEDMVGLLSEYLANKATFHIEGIVSSRLCTPSYLIITKEILDSFKDYYLKHSKIYNFIDSGCFNYLDEITKKPTFEGKNGKNYVEAHHIIEFSTEDGPDITDNLICLGPQNHSLIHHGSDGAVSEFYRTCQTRGVLTFDRFKSICVKYRCLTHKHVVILEHKKMISKTDAEELNVLIDEYGVDPIFLSSLTTPAGD